MAKRKNKSGANLSHEEIWDDTALVRSWDEAVEEYNVCSFSAAFEICSRD
jgi:hypothetical protein